MWNAGGSMANRHGHRGRRYTSNRSKVLIPSPVLEDTVVSNPNSLNVSKINKGSESLYKAYCRIHNDTRNRRQLLDNQQTRLNFHRFGFNNFQNRSSKSITMFFGESKGVNETSVRLNDHIHPLTFSSEKNGDDNSRCTYLEPGVSFSHVPFTVIQPLHHSNTFIQVSNRSEEDYQAETNVRRQKTLVVKLPSVLNSEPEIESRPDPFPTLTKCRTLISKKHSGLSDKIVLKLKSINAVPTTPKINTREQKEPIHPHPKRESTSLSAVSNYDNKSFDIPKIKVCRCELVHNIPTFKTNASPLQGNGGTVKSSKRVEILPSIGNPDLPKIPPILNEYKGSKLTQRTSPIPKYSRKSTASDSFSIAHINKKRAIAQRRLRKSTVIKKQTGSLGDTFLYHHFPLRRMDTINTATVDTVGKRLEYETDIRALLKQNTLLRTDKRCGTEFDFKLLTIEPWRRVSDYSKVTQHKPTSEFAVSHINLAAKTHVSSRKQEGKLSLALRCTDRYTDADIDSGDEDEEEQPDFEFTIRNSLSQIQTAVRE